MSWPTLTFVHVQDSIALWCQRANNKCSTGAPSMRFKRYWDAARQTQPPFAGAMGCVSSKADSDFAALNIFHVMNVDDVGRRLCPGQLEVGETDIVLYQRGKAPMRWPLRSLRRYGFDAELFSFECGRRCPTGPGIFAFQCRRAEQLFNTVQARVASQDIGFTRSRIRSTFPQINGLAERDETDEEGAYLEPIRIQGPAWTMNSRPLSATSLISSGSSPISPLTNAAAAALYVNSDVVLGANEHQSTLMEAVIEDEPVLSPPSAYANLDTNYTKLDELLRSDEENNQHLYINVGPETVHEVKAPLLQPATPSVRQQVNYVLLDLDKGSDSTTTASVTAHPVSPQGSDASLVESPHRTVVNISQQQSTTLSCAPSADGYATIDFDRTAALSNAVTACAVHNDIEGSRKTRHNSTMTTRMLTLNRQTSSVSD